jgi:hypothetical protein
MILNRENVSHGALVVGKLGTAPTGAVVGSVNAPPPALDWDALAASTDGYVLTCSAAAPEGVAWVAATSVNYLTSTYILKTADANLANAQVLGSLAGGIMKCAATTGVVSIASAGTDYAAAAGGSGIVTVGTITSGTWHGTAIATGYGGTGAASATLGFDALSPMSALGDLIYGGAAGANQRLAGNTTTTKKFLRQTGNSTASAAPAWDTIVTGDLPSNIVISGSIATNGISSAPAQAAFPGTAGGTDATVINKITAILVALGFCAAS